MKIARIFCVLMVSLMALSPVGGVFAQEEPEYALTMTPSDGRYDTIMMAGRDKDFRVDLENTGRETIHRVTVAMEAPDGWTYKTDPTGIASLEVFGNERVYVTIKPPESIAAGDYMIKIMAAGEEASAEEIEVRVTIVIPSREASFEMRAIYPRLEAIAGEDFVFEVEFKYAGADILGESRSFELVPTAPPGWEVSMTPPYEKEKRISAIDLKPSGVTYTDKTRVVVSAPFWPLPEPGEYKVTLEAVSGELRDSVEFTAVITAMYNLLMLPVGERYDTKATAGKDNYFSIEVGNLGTAPIDKINFSSDKPDGWTIELVPEKIDTMEALNSQTVDVNIKPPAETIAGDYMVSLRASGAQATSERLNIRVTVETPTLWGWIGVVIIAVVIAGLVLIFMRFSRR